MSAASLDNYQSCLWVDADILINPLTPDPYSEREAELWGVTIESGSRCSNDTVFIKHQTEQALTDVARKQNLKWNGGYFESWGFSSQTRPLFNAGVIGFCPAKHKSLLEHIYYDWEDGGPGSLAEMTPFNLVASHSGYELLDERYNRLIFPYSSAWNSHPEQTCKDLGFARTIRNPEAFLLALFHGSFFLHFAGMHNLMSQLAPVLTTKAMAWANQTITRF